MNEIAHGKGPQRQSKVLATENRAKVRWDRVWLAPLLILVACNPANARSVATPTTAYLCAPGSEIERTVVSGAQMGQGTTVAFAIPSGRTPVAIAVLDQSDALVACSFFTEPLPITGIVNFPLDSFGDSVLAGSVELSPGEGRYEGRLAIKLTTRGNDPFAPYWVVLIGT